MKPYPARSVFMTNLHRVQASLGSRIFACVVLSCALFSTQVAGQTDEDDSLNQMFLDYGLPNPLRPDRQRPVDQRLIQIETQGIAGSGLFPGQVYVAHNAAEVQALSNTLSPGDQLVLSASGNWVDALFTFQGHGTYAAPILIRGETPGGVVFTGHSRLYFHGENLVVMDFKLQNVQVAGSGTTLLNLGAGGIEASDSILDRVEIVDCNSPNPADWPVVRMFYAQVRGPRNTVANCTFSGMKHYGQMLTAENLPVGELQQLHVLNNHFVNRPHIDEQNGYEIIQIGWSGEYAASSGSLLQGNIFENCAGENETISLKASDIYVRDNQFLGCQGVLSLRVADRVLIQNNIFDGSGINNTGGVRLAGAGHVVVGNTFTDLRQPANYYSWPVSLMAASAEEASSDIDGYGRAKNILIAHNLFDRNDRRIAVGIYPSATYPLLPENVQIRDNTFTFNDATTAVDYTAPDLPAGAVTEAGNGFSPPDAAPWVPTYLTATDIAGNVVLSWTSSLGATGYEIERAATSSGPFTLIGSASGPYYTDDTVSGGQTYYYRVTAANSFGSSPASAEVGITLPLTTKTVLLDDDFSDNDRTTQNLPTSAAWFSSTSTSAGRLLVDDGALELNVGTQVGTQTVAYFADAAGNPAELADIGDSLVVRFTSKYTRTAAADTTSGFRFGLLSSEGGPRQTADSVSGSTLWDTYRGYAILHGSNSAISGWERKTTGVTSNSYLLNGLGNYNSLSATQTATVSLQPAVTYQGTLILTRTSTGLDIFYSLVDRSNPANAWTYRTSDSSPNTYRYDTLAFSDENLFTQTIDNIEVTLRVPNPSSPNSVPHIQTVSLPDGTVGVAYSQTLTATDGDGTLLWSVAAGSLPAGLTLSNDGVISGAPTATGTSSVTLRLQDTDDFNDASDEDTRELSIAIAPGAAAITLDQLSAVYDGAPKSVTATTIPAGLAVNITYNDSATAPTNAGSYAVAATIADPNYVGSASDTLVISPAIATVALGNLTQTYDDTPRNAIVTTQPSGVAVAVTYDGSLTVPTNAGSYTVAAAVIDPNYIGSTSGTLTISQASAAISLARLRRTYDGTPKTAAAVTIPAGLAVELTYDGQSEPPTLPGSYAIAATIDDTNYAGSVSGTLVIASTALVRHAPTLNGNIDGSVQVLLAENITLNGGATIDGDLLVPGTPAVTVNGNALYAGVQDGPGAAASAQYHVILNGNVVLRYLVRRVDPIDLPAVDTPPLPAGTANLTLNDSGQGVSNWSAIHNLTLNGNAGVRAVPPGTYGNLTVNGSSGFIFGITGSTEPAIYNLQGLTLNSGSQLQIVGPVILTLAHGSSFQGAVGNSDHPEWLQLRIASGDLTLNGNAILHGEVAAPDGTVTINGNAALHGSVSADRFILNGNGLLSEVTTQ